jgi:hypothetical protein
MLLNKATDEWQKGLVEFMKSTFEGTSRGGTAPCPYLKCCCMTYRTRSEVQSHLLARGFDANFIKFKIPLSECLFLNHTFSIAYKKLSHVHILQVTIKECGFNIYLVQL